MFPIVNYFRICLQPDETGAYIFFSFVFSFCFYCKDIISFVILYTSGLKSFLSVLKVKSMLTVLYIKLAKEEKREEEINSASLLGEDAFQKIVSMRNIKSRTTRFWGEVLRNYGLKIYWGMDIGTYTLIRGAHGKPYIKERKDVFFNISHSGEYVLCAFSDTSVGVDIEKKGKLRLTVARRFFHAEEIQQLENTWGEEKQAELFYRLWSVKESFLKYTGEGLSASFSAFAVNFENAGLFLRKGKEKIEVKISECKIDPCYVSYICSGSQEVPVIREVGLTEILSCL